MTIVTKRYVRKPIFVDAVQVTEKNFEELARWCTGAIERPLHGSMYISVRVTNPKTVKQTRAYVGDWILYSETGYKIYTEVAFANTFDLAESDGTAVQAVRQQVR